MTCERFETRLPDGTVISGIVCSRGRPESKHKKFICKTCGAKVDVYGPVPVPFECDGCRKKAKGGGT